MNEAIIGLLLCNQMQTPSCRPPVVQSVEASDWLRREGNSEKMQPSVVSQSPTRTTRMIVGSHSFEGKGRENVL